MDFVIWVLTVILIFDKNDTDSNCVKHSYKNKKYDCTVDVTQTPQNLYTGENESYLKYTFQMKIDFQII